MKALITFLTTLIIGLFLGYFFCDRNNSNTITVMTHDIDSLKYENIELKKLLSSADETYNLLEKKQKILNHMSKSIETHKEMSLEKDKLIEELILIKNEYEIKKKSLDSLYVRYPNRQGEELINSIKLKTNL